MQLRSGFSYSGASRTSTHLSSQMETNGWELFPQSDPYRASSDTSLFSSSLPALANEKLNLNEQKHDHQSACGASPSLKVNEVIIDGGNHTNGSFLPDEDELLSEVYDFEASWLPNLVDDSEECDFFGSGGGLELENVTQENLRAGVSNLSLSNGDAGNGGPHLDLGNGVGTLPGEHPLGEHPSRTLFIRNINSSVEDDEIRSLFADYGNIKKMYTACKSRGFVMLSYYDIRAAQDAIRGLQNQLLRRRKLDIHYSIPKENPTDEDINQGTLVILNLEPSVSNDELLTIFGAHGEIKEIRETPFRRHHRFIEYYDIRASEAALISLNGCKIAGKCIRLEPSRPGGARQSLLLHMNQEHDQGERILHHVRSLVENSSPAYAYNQNPPLSSSLPGSSTRPFSGPQYFYGNSGLYAETTATRAQVIMRPFIPSPNDVFPFVNNHASFCCSDQPHHFHAGSAHSVGNATPVFSIMSPTLSPGFPFSWRAEINEFGRRQFILDLDKIRSGEDTRTTLMIKNIPNKYTSKMLLDAIDEYHVGTYDFIYLPIDFRNKCNVGYAFINMLSPAYIIPFYEAFNGKKWDKFNSEKVVSLAYARIQGLAALVARFQNSSLMHEDKCCRPIVLNSESPESRHRMNGPLLQNLQSNGSR